jgi:cytoskeletal protein CcmA (bactofilin family)
MFSKRNDPSESAPDKAGGGGPSEGPLVSRRSRAASSSSRKHTQISAGSGRKLVVGEGICLSGEVKSCETLIVEGTVEAELTDCRVLEVSELGLFKGKATIELCEVSGRFEGELTVRERLLIRSKGRVTGIVSYRDIQIEHGGKINGSLEEMPADEAPAEGTDLDEPDSAASKAASDDITNSPDG